MRWMDNDAYAHVNNVVHYSWLDTAVNAWLVGTGVLDMQGRETIGVVAQTHCNFLRSLAFPQDLQIGLRVARCHCLRHYRLYWRPSNDNIRR